MKPIVETPVFSSDRSPVDGIGEATTNASVQPKILNFPCLTFGRWFFLIGLFSVLFLVTLVGCLRFGTHVIELSRMLAVFSDGISAVHTNPVHSDLTSVILLQVRLPRILLAFLVGGSLAVVGVSLQALLRNPLADPFVLGISSGAALGAAMGLLFGVGISVWSLSTLPICALLGALITIFIIYQISATHHGFSIYTLLLAGVVLSSVFSALIMFITSVADPDRAFGIFAWLMGSLTGPDYSTLGILMGYIGIGLLVLASQAQSLNVLTLGEETARSLGVEVERVKKIVFFGTALLTGAVVAFSGLIAFVGLIVPHALRLVIGADHRLLLPIAGLTGGVFLMVVDTVGRTLISPTEIPVGVLTALIGGPVFLYLLMNRRMRLVR